MKNLILLLVIIILSCCGEDDEAIPQPMIKDCTELDCPHEDEFYGKAVMNDESWLADWIYTDLTSSSLAVFLLKAGPDNIGEQLVFTIYNNSNWQDTIWLGSPYSNDPPPNFARAIYDYSEGHSSVGYFRFNTGDPPTGDDYLLIDDVNADTTIIEGRFQVRFPIRSVNSYVTAPDTMRLGCGRFRVEVE
jgi:hypothetical protein